MGESRVAGRKRFGGPAGRRHGSGRSTHAGTRRGRRWVSAAILGLASAAGPGCVHSQYGPQVPGPGLPAGPGVPVPPPGSIPVELYKIALPPYVIEAPDQLLIEVVLKSTAKNDKTGRDEETVQPLPTQAVSGSFQVRIDGTVGLGMWGSVPVAGLSWEQAADAIRQKLVESDTLKKYGIKAESLVVIVDTLAYNSKRYYVVTDGGGAGEQVYPFLVTGSETVLDAISNINGLPAVASKRNIWVARRCPHPAHPWQVLPVDWVGITQHGLTTTNYQIMPGDRVYVKAQRLVTIDTMMARFFAPFERVLGIILLGANTSNQIKGNVNGTGN